MRLERLESEALSQDVKVPTVRASSSPLTQNINSLTQRLDRIENTIAPLIQALERVPQMVRDEEVSVEAEDDVNVDSESKLESTLPQTLEYPLSQRQLSLRLGQPYSYYLQKHRQKGKEHFEAWSQSQDPDGIAWTFDEPKRRRGKVSGKALKFYPKS